MAKSQKQVMDMRPGKGFTAAQSNEHTRNWTEKGWAQALKVGNYDRSRVGLNFEVVGGKIVPVDTARSIPQRIKEILAARNIKDPNEGLAEPKYRTVANFIFGGSRERMHELAFGEQKVDTSHGADNSEIVRKPEIEQWAVDVYNFVARKYGEQNIAAFIVHLDELNPHVHCTLLPIDEDNKFAYKRIFAGKSIYEYKERMVNLHNEFAEVNEKWGLNRGDNISETGAKHRTTEEYRRALSHECTELEEQITESKSLLFQLRNEVAHAEKRVKGLNTMIANLENRKVELEGEMAEIEEQIKSGESNTAELQAKQNSIAAEYNKTVAALDDKRGKLAIANRTLEELRALEAESQEKAEFFQKQAENFRESAKQYSRQTIDGVQAKFAELALMDALPELKSTVPLSSLNDEMPLYHLAVHANKFIQCATSLFFGYVDGATTIAENCGGGGPTSSSPWGRNEDEDDRKYMMRCLAQASQMMRPRSGKSLKRK
jgi:predicted  nucleic acid-binding Zn-ribbon protein